MNPRKRNSDLLEIIHCIERSFKGLTIAIRDVVDTFRLPKRQHSTLILTELRGIPALSGLGVELAHEWLTVHADMATFFITADNKGDWIMRQMPMIHQERMGRHPGIYQTWNECKAQVLEYPNAEFKGFSNMEEARVSFLNYHGQVKLKPESASALTPTTSGSLERISVRAETLLWIIIGLLGLISLLSCFAIYLAMVDYH
ncbi:hypothetical protein MRB53_020591 [Persea americana]|uniref:Uncharacterized protein n=1 Tax=Persea americana TaxID=3435 RepID=A0ACC2L2L9_PERAE|nr:hypothetical protein MRB53_020591 [Persea americana]